MSAHYQRFWPVREIFTQARDGSESVHCSTRLQHELQCNDTRNVYQGIQDGYLDATFINNHDKDRLIDKFAGNMAKNELSVAILLTLPGVPYIYYGDEIGMFGQKPDPNIREPFLVRRGGRKVSG